MEQEFGGREEHSWGGEVERKEGEQGSKVGTGPTEWSPGQGP